MSESRQRFCPNCNTQTRFDSDESYFTGEKSPFRCCVCGTESDDRTGEDGHFTDFAEDETECPCDVIRLARRAPVGSEEDLFQPVKDIAAAVEAEGPVFKLYGRSPAHTLYPLRTGTEWIVDKFVATSEIQWNFGREPQDPTHEVVFHNIHQDAPRSVFLKVEFVLAGNESGRPGLVIELHVPQRAASAPGDRTERLDRLFSRLIEIVRPDYGFVELPGHPEDTGWPNSPDTGWLTYLAKPAGAVAVPAPAVVVPFADGVKITATPGAAPTEYDAVKEAIAGVREASLA